jgi:hypothetical protein
MAVSGFGERIERMAVSGFGERIERMAVSGFWERIERMAVSGFGEPIERMIAADSAARCNLIVEHRLALRMQALMALFYFVFSVIFAVRNSL